jgi:hypothetical protein
MAHAITLVRTISKRSSQEKIEAQIDFILGRALNSNRGSGWDITARKFYEPKLTKDGWKFQCDLTLEKIKGRGRGGETEYKQWEEIKAMLIQSGRSTKFQDSPWNATFSEEPNVASNGDEGEDSDIVDVKTVAGTISDRILDWKDLHVPQELLDSDEALAEHPAFSDLYDIGPQIRTVLSAIKRAVDTNGASRYHSVLYGEPGCGKTSTLRAVEKLLGPGSVLHLDATSTTKAGIEKLFFSELKEYPKIVFLEEAEKAPEEGLKVWLGALDDRGELRKVNFRQTQVREIQILFFCTANNKRAFDNMMGTGSGEPGALSSRCVNEIQFPRPAAHTLRKILEKEIDQKGGKRDWITPCLNLARELNVTDPRKVKAFLTGGDRLLDGTFQKDQRVIRGLTSMD